MSIIKKDGTIFRDVDCAPQWVTAFRNIIMKKRYIYTMLFGVPGLLISLIISFIIFGMTTGLLWLYFFGDNPWPLTTEKTLPLLFVLIFIPLWVTFITVGYLSGKNLESDPAINRKHVVISFILTLTPLFLIVIHQLRVGNIGPKSASILCSDFCSQNGYSASAMPPKNSGQRLCSCFNESGVETVKVPINTVVPSK